ncbi:MAG: hypothetical protein IPH07_36965 [Deltaproteobacteria bacterium]|nr:hypothetical protein [Deltaproteobacteria bacterium]MBK8235787.1 hypothetical protein [Deltaproteobacteria bacterium]MBK8713416.1 hypothetical protein [Deltaproteobacteria bacterium]MBP7288041.1 hypothetical protein [Nannocystaceae bacterium]
MPSLRAIAIGVCLGLGFAACGEEPGDEVPRSCSDASRLSLFDDRIAPLLIDGNKSACNQCHLAGIDLGLYSKSADECTTIACMAESGIVDLEQPESSVVLTWILRGEPDSALITEEVLQQEHDGVLEWIRFHAECGSSVCEPVDNPCGDSPVQGTCETPPSGHDLPPRGWTDPGDCSDRTLEDAFAALVYTWRGRCYPCHYASKPGDPEDAPRWIIEGDCALGAVQSMHQVQSLGLVDLANPDQSKLLLKPLAESIGGVEHGGGDKFLDAEDGAYGDFRTWVHKLADCQAQ